MTVQEQEPVEKVAAEAAAEQARPWAAALAKIRSVKPMERTYWLPVDRALEDAAEAAEEHAQAVRNQAFNLRWDDVPVAEESAKKRQDILDEVNDLPEVKKAERAETAAKKAAQDTRIPLTFRAVPRDLFEQIRDDNPPTEALKAKGYEYNPAGFVPKIMAACHVFRDADGVESPGMTEDEARELFNNLSQADAQALLAAVIGVNTTTRFSVEDQVKG